MTAAAATPPAKKTISFEEAFQRWKDGAAVSALKREFNLPHLKRKIVAHVGGLEAFQKLRAAGAGGRGFGAPGGTLRTAVPPAPPPDDRKVPTVAATPVKDGWRTRRLTTGHGTVETLVAPDGTVYAPAKPTEHAHLIRKPPKGEVTRWVRLESSAAGKSAQKVERKAKALLDHAEQAKHVRRKAPGRSR